MPGKRMYAHDYNRVGFYMITIVTAGRRRLFGECADNKEIAHAVMEQEYGSLILLKRCAPTMAHRSDDGRPLLAAS